MNLVLAINNLMVYVDPLDHWNNESTTPEQVMDTMGFIPVYVGMAYQEHTEDVAEAVVKMYGMGSWSEDTLGTFTEEGVKTYPEDPDQYPLLVIKPLDSKQALKSNVTAVYMYEHEWVAFQFKDGTFKHLRMD